MIYLEYYEEGIKDYGGEKNTAEGTYVHYESCVGGKGSLKWGSILE